MILDETGATLNGVLMGRGEAVDFGDRVRRAAKGLMPDRRTGRFESV